MLGKCLPGDQFVFDADFLTNVPKAEVALVRKERELKGIDFAFLSGKKKNGLMVLCSKVSATLMARERLCYFYLSFS